MRENLNIESFKKDRQIVNGYKYKKVFNIMQIKITVSCYLFMLG